jgi:outer membrane receptor protein involved in Fe transport
MKPHQPLTPLMLALGLAIGASPGRAQTRPAPAAAGTEAIELSPFVIRDEKDRGYGSTQSLGATRVALPNAEISSAIVTLNEQVIADRGAVNAMEVLSFVSGIQRDSDGQPGAELFSLRGYATGNIGLRDGLPDPMNAADLPIGSDTSSYSRIEVIKGPAGVLYGTHSMGGVVNRISKWPLFRASTKVELQAQNDEQFIRAAVDSTGPIGSDLAYRVTLSARRGERFFDEGEAPNDLNNLTLSLLRRVHGGSGRLWFRGEHLRFELDREQGWQFITGFIDPARPTVAPTISRNGNYPLSIAANTVPEDDVSLGEAFGLEAGYESSFAGPLNGRWTLRTVARYSDREGDKVPSYAQGRPVPVDASGAVVRYTNAAGAQVAGDNRFIRAGDPRVADWRATLVLRDFRGFGRSHMVNADLSGLFSTGVLDHNAVLSTGLTGGESARSFFFWNAVNPGNTTAVANSFSAVRPTPANVTAESIKASAATQYNPFSGYSDGRNFSTSVLDNISFLNKRFVASVGWRYDNARSTTARFHTANSIAARQPVIDGTSYQQTKNSQHTYRYGLVFKPVPGLSVFGQVNSTFQPVSGTNVLTGEPLENRDGTNREVGLKLELWDNRVTGTVSYFKSKLTNVLVPVVLPIEQGGGTFNLPVGSQNSDGWEMDIAFQPVQGLSLLASYSDVTSLDERGFAFRGVPVDPSYSLLTRYSWAANSRLAGLFVGGGWKQRGRSPGDATRTFFVGSSDQYDAVVGFARRNWSVQLNVENLTDSDAAWSSVTDQLVVRLQPRAFRVTARYSF